MSKRELRTYLWATLDEGDYQDVIDSLAIEFWASQEAEGEA